MNDRSAEKQYILAAVLEDHGTSISVKAMREDTEYGTEAYFWRLSFTYDAQEISVESYSYGDAVLKLWNAAEALGLLDGQFIID